ncbi:LamG-like jellyroll fold domain-containing protein [Flavobacterium sp. PLA-1-15]|uniref:LamG-like jellyroll fold domain-containing protein n=1 Tax=Flavobacterium sp. PLA-1-15 TaxID=3380533 RepID=UPI003B790A26
MKKNKFLSYLMAFGFGITVMTSCGNDDSNKISLPPIGGFNTADEIAMEDLVGYWPLNGDGVEIKSNTSPSSSVGATYSEGIKGQGVTFTNGYLAYPEIEALASTLPSMSISLWGKITNNGGADGHQTMMFSLGRPDHWAGNINLMAETGWKPATNDSLTIKGFVQIKNESGTADDYEVINKIKATEEELADGHTPFANKNSGRWAHYVAIWNAETGFFQLFANGIKISDAKLESKNEGNPLPLNFFTPTKPVIGTFATVVSGTGEAWQKSMNGQLDEIRVWKKALTSTEITALYELEKAGR